MWKCKNCSEQIENNFDICWSCGYSRDGSPPKESDNISSEAVLPNGELLSRIAASSTTSRSRTDIAQALTRRYTDAYIAARWLIRIGSIIKWVGSQFHHRASFQSNSALERDWPISVLFAACGY